MVDTSSPLSLSASPSVSDATGRRSSPSSALAFLVHSPDTVGNNLPPDVDNKPLARQKRRRTSKEDEEILKAEYLRNPKPDKAARMEIVSKIALGEKEVQIWFQNKRQNDRRRSRPLESSSTPSLMSSSSTMSDPVAEDDSNVHENENAEDLSEDASTSEDAHQPDQPEITSADSQTTTIVSAQTESQSTTEPATIPSTDPHTVETTPTELSSSQQTVPSSSQGPSQPRTSYLANRRSASFIRYTEEYTPETASMSTPALPTTESSSTTRTLNRTRSFVRLSMTADGKARVITDADQSPSPPHTKSNPSTFSRAAGGLRRSYSAAGLNERLAAASREGPSPKIPRTGTNIGRSRDSRAWEFWCDPDSRNSLSLTTKAEQEGSGSAADAIGLIRANSRKALAQNQSRANTPVLSRTESSKVMGEQGVKKSRAPFHRASTTHGRLQTEEGKKDGSESDELPQTESDKENWEPDLPQSRRQRNPLYPPATSQRPRQILGENTEIMSQSQSLGAMLDREQCQKGNQGRENVDPEQNEEIRLFMNGGLSGRTSLSSAEEAGCVEGLLKLSKGNWR
ncbi:hypothetical protein K469DRAFT_575043 [Zopfia rhizophila CBS 207.26]|uniref:Homeobox domain-containing protein n=1 Tax=Zopfia rhizophila CBS 207.26 TaxID=1314779 RepID=A0A6A6E411_9PEZI|nr:hypothetical protein K469DRAFT_575043 [Zopfia rhizophila CBS 207.26]